MMNRFARVALALTIASGSLAACSSPAVAPDAQATADSAVTGDSGTGDSGTGDSGTGDSGTGDSGTDGSTAPDAGMDGGELEDASALDDAASADDAAITTDTDHLLISEVVLSPDNAELIEIYNPTTAAIDLTGYFLSDSRKYALLPGGVSFTEPPDSTDFIVSFPPGTTIAAGDALSIATNIHNLSPITTDTTDYPGHYGGRCPDFRLGHASDDATPCPTAMPMVHAVRPSGGAGMENTTLRNAGEFLVLFRWDGASDLVTDVDYLVWGVATALNPVLDKTGVTVDGPDADSTPSAYLPDTAEASQHVRLTDLDRSQMRCDYAEGTEDAVGGNGVGGHDETSEDFTMTWQAGLPSVGDVIVATPGAPNACVAP